jgi:hypothetical protein
VREAVDTRELREAALDFVEVWEAVEGRADREAILPGMTSARTSIIGKSRQARRACRARVLIGKGDEERGRANRYNRAQTGNVNRGLADKIRSAYSISAARDTKSG